MTISHARAKELFDYDPKSGELRWKVGRSNIRSGSLAGTQKRNYIVVSIDNKLYRAHKIVWLLVTGEWPKSFIDGHKIHIGHFATPKEAAGAYAKAAKKYFGEFWRAT